MDSVEKTIKVNLETHERLTKLGVKGETYEDIVVSLLEETAFLQRFKDAVEKAKKENQAWKTTGVSRYVDNTVNELCALINEFIQGVESR